MRARLAGIRVASLVLCFAVAAGLVPGWAPLRCAAAETIRIGIAIPMDGRERWFGDLRAIIAKADAMGPEVDLLIQLTRNDQALQQFHIEQLITSGVKALIVTPQDSFGAAPLVRMAHDAGIRIISYDRLIRDADVDLFVSYDNMEIGRMQARYLVQRVPKGRYVLLFGPRYDSNANFYRDGALEVLRPRIDAGDIEVVYEGEVKDWETSVSQGLVETALLKSGNRVDAVLAPNDSIAAGAVAALADQKLAGKVPVTGQDAEVAAVRRILAGTQSMTVFKDVRREADAAVDAAVRLVKGENLGPLTLGRTVDNGRSKVPSILLEPVVVEKANIEETVVGSGYIDGKLLR